MSQWRVFCLFLGLCSGLSLLGGCASQMALSDRDCMTRVMYFESNRSSPDGMLAVGTTVMNRLESGRYPGSVCAVVGQRNQFAPGVLTKPMNPKQAARIAEVADRVLSGDRHPQVGGAMFFHTAGYSFPYNNMHYVAAAGGNVFYEKRSVPAGTPPELPPGFPDAPRSSPLLASRAKPTPSTIDDLLAGPTPPRRPDRTMAALAAPDTDTDRN